MVGAGGRDARGEAELGLIRLERAGENLMINAIIKREGGEKTEPNSSQGHPGTGAAASLLQPR